jgi:hypothetical protein
MLGRCCECGRRVWPWQESPFAGDQIHWTCHRKMLQETMSRSSEALIAVMNEASYFSAATGRKIDL